MRKALQAVLFSIVSLPVLFLSTGCAMHSAEEAMQRADRALEQAELCNQRVDRMSEMYGGK